MFCSVFVLFACQPQQSPTPAPSAIQTPVELAIEIHGHRGARGLAPENTLPSFEAALDLEVRVLELDLHLSRDGEVVVWHDPYVFSSRCRTTGPLDRPESPVDMPTSWSRPRPLDGPVVDPDSLPSLHPALAIANQRADQLRRLRCDRNPAPELFPDQRRADDRDYGIVTLPELFAFVARYATDPKKTASQRENAASVQFNIELKRVPMYPAFIADRFDGENPAHFERALHDALVHHAVMERAIVQSFDHRSLWAFRKLSPSVRLAALQRESDPVDDLAALRERGATIWAPDHRLVDASTVKRAHEAGLLVIPWTVNDTERAEALVTLGVDGLITDRPDLLVAARD